LEKSKSFEDLIVWQKAHQFVLKVYSVSTLFPKSELYGLTSQYRRAAVSIAANIAEGYKRIGTKDKLRFMNIAQASLEECRYYILLAKDLKYTTNEDSQCLRSKIEEVSKILFSYVKVMKQNQS
jgi:four helix bundle protein